MAAATPGRPSLCIVPSNDVLSLAEELQGLGGNDIALATTTLLTNLNDAPQEVSQWLTNGFSATIAPCTQDLTALVTFLEQVVARLEGSLQLALGWSTATNAPSSRVVDCTGKPLTPAASGLRNGGTAIRFNTLAGLHSILRLALSTRHSGPALVLSLGVFNPADSALACLNIIHLSNSNGVSAAIFELMGEVADLHGRRRAGEYILRTAQLGEFNQVVAAPLIAGNVRLFIPLAAAAADGDNCGWTMELAQRMVEVKTVCTRVQSPAADLKWMSVEEYVAKMKKPTNSSAKEMEKSKASRGVLHQEKKSTTPTPRDSRQPEHSSPSFLTSSSAAEAIFESSQNSIAQRKEQRARASLSLQNTAAAIRADRQRRVSSASQEETHHQHEKINDEIDVDDDDEAWLCSSKLVVDIPSVMMDDHNHSLFEEPSFGFDSIPAVRVQAPSVAAVAAVAKKEKSQHHRSLVEREKDSIKVPTDLPPPSVAVHRNSFSEQLTSPSADVRYGSPTPLPPTSSSFSSAAMTAAAMTEPPSSAHHQQPWSYAAAFKGASLQSSLLGAKTPSVSVCASHLQNRVDDRGENSSSGGGNYSSNNSSSRAQQQQQQQQPPPSHTSAALQRRLWASSTAVHPISDVFASTSLPPLHGHELKRSGGVDDGVDGSNEQHQPLHFDLSEQSAQITATAAASVASASYHGSRGGAEEEAAPCYYSSSSSHLTRGDDGGDYSGDVFKERSTLLTGSVVLRPPPAAAAVQLSPPSPPQYSIETHHHHQQQQQQQRPVSAGGLAAELSQEKRINAVLLRQLQDAEQRAATATAAAASVPPLENIDPGDFNGLLAALQRERQRSAQLGETVALCSETHLKLEVHMAELQRENAVFRARCRALERGTPLAVVFAQCEDAVKGAQQLAARLQKENVDLARAVADAELAAIMKSALGGGGGDDTEDMTATAVIGALHKKLQRAQTQLRKLQDEAAAQQESARATQSAIRAAAVNKHSAEDAVRRNNALQASQSAWERRAEQQALAAAEAWALVEELQRERDEALMKVEVEQERGESLLHLAESLQLRAKVGSEAWRRQEEAV